MTTETTEIVEALYKSTMLGQTQAVMRPSGTNRVSDSPLMDSLGNPSFKALLAMIALTGMAGMTDKRETFVAAVASGVTYGYDEKQMGSATSLLLSGSYKEGVAIEGTDVTVSYEELTEISSQILILADKELPEEIAKEMMSDKSRMAFCLVFGAEYAKYQKGVASLEGMDFSAPVDTDDGRVSPDEQAGQELDAWQTAMQISLARVSAALDDEKLAEEHGRIGDFMPDVFTETMVAYSAATHAMLHEKGSAHSECGTEEHHLFMLKAMFMFGRAVEEFATSRLHHLGELRFKQK